MKRNHLIPSLALLLVAALGAAACQSRTDAEGNPTMGSMMAKRSVKDVTVGHQLAADGSIAADQKGKSFKPGEIVYVAFDISKAPAGTVVQVNWFGPDNKPVGSDTETVRSGQTNMNFASPDTSNWGTGDYHAEVTVGDKKVDSEKFKIVEPGKEDQTATKPGNAVSDVAIGHQLGAGGMIAADQKGKYFAPGDPVVLAFKVGEAPAGTLVHVDWMGPDGKKVASQDNKVARGNEYMHFAVPNTSGWGKGDYRAEVSVNGQQVDTERFSLVDREKADKHG
jgi:hypothetical protein